MIEKVTFEETTFLAAAGAVRGGDAAHRRRGRAARGGRLGREARRSTRSTRTNARWSPRRRAALSRDPRRHPLRARGQRRDRQLQRRGGASARHRHHIGRCGRRGPRRPPLRAAADGLARRRRDRAGELRGAQRQLGHRGAGARDRAGEADFRHERGTQDRDRGGRRRRTAAAGARHAPTFERKRDYLAGFLAGEKPAEPAGGAGRRSPGGGDRGAEVDLRPRNPGRHLRARPDLRRRRSPRMATRSSP